MNSLKTVFMVGVLVVIAYAVYVSLNTGPEQGPPPGVEDDWAGPPEISIPGAGEGGPAVSMGSPNDFPSAGVPPMSSRSSEPSLAPSFPERPPAPPFQPAPLPPEISSEVVDSPPTTAPPYQAPLPPNSQPPMPPASSLAGSPTAASEPQLAAEPPLPDFDAGMPPLPPGSVGTGFGEARKPQAEGVRPEFADFLAEARGYLDQGRFRETLGILSSRYGDPHQTEAESKSLTELLDQVAGTVIYSTEHHLEPAYVVQAGDTLPQIAENYDVPWELLAKINSIPDPMNLQPGRELKVVRGPFRALVKLDDHEMVLWLQDLYAGRFEIGLGTVTPEMEGSFTVREKLRNPTYYDDATGRQYDPGDPLNPLGKRRIGLGGTVALHGTNDPANIGKTGGPGNVCLGEQDVEDVFDILSLNSRIVIRR